MLLLKIDRSSTVPAYQQVCNQVVGLVERGALRPGDRLPPTRELGTAVGLHRSSIVRAYSELQALGYIVSRPGSYTTIRRRQRPPATLRNRPDSDEPCLLDWDTVAHGWVNDLCTHPSLSADPSVTERDIVDFDRLCADPGLAPDDDLRRCIKQVLLRTGGAALDYSEAAGWRPLREVLAKRMCNHGIAVNADEIIITTGAQHALDLVMRLLTSPGDRVVVEKPSYGMAHALMKLHKVRPIEVPMHEHGMDLKRLRKVLHKGQRPALVFTMPNFQNPTGITTSQQHRERLLSLCETYQVPLVEDGFEEEMKYSGQAILPIKSMDSKGIVIYVGTFSKVVFPGLRIGWIAAPRPCVGHLTRIMQASCISGNTLAQAAAARYCASSEFERYLRRVHRVYRLRMHTLMQGLERHMPPGVSWTRPSGGYTAWLTLDPCPLPARELAGKFLQAGVKTGPGERYFCSQPASTHLRLSIACVTNAQIETGCRLLGQTLRELND